MEKKKKDEECSDQSWEVHNDQLRAIIKANPLITMWEVAEELQHQPLYDHCTFEAKWKGEKAWQVGASQADQESKKSSLWSVVFTYSTQQQQTISLLDCDMWQKEDFTMTSLVTGLRRSSQVLPKAKLEPKKRSWSLFGGLLLAWSPTASWILTKPLQIWEVYSANQGNALKTAMPAASIGHQKGANSA